MKVVIEDALVFLDKTAALSLCFLSNISNHLGEAEKFDIIFCDLAGSLNAEGLSCPPPVFILPKNLENMKNSLKQHGSLSSARKGSGVLALNVVTRDDDVSARVKKSVADHFASLFAISAGDDVNEVGLFL